MASSHKTTHQKKFEALKKIGLSSKIAGKYKDSAANRSYISRLFNETKLVRESPSNYQRVFSSKLSDQLGRGRVRFIAKKGYQEARIDHGRIVRTSYKPLPSGEYLKIEAREILRAGPNLTERLEKLRRSRIHENDYIMLQIGGNKPFRPMLRHEVEIDEETGEETETTEIEELLTWLDNYKNADGFPIAALIEEINVIRQTKVKTKEANKLAKSRSSMQKRIRSNTGAAPKRSRGATKTPKKSVSSGKPKAKARRRS